MHACALHGGGDELGETIGRAQRMDAPSLTVDLLEHAEHVLEVRVVQEPDGGVLVVLLKGHWARGDRRIGLMSTSDSRASVRVLAYCWTAREPNSQGGVLHITITLGQPEMPADTRDNDCLQGAGASDSRQMPRLAAHRMAARAQKRSDCSYHILFCQHPSRTSNPQAEKTAQEQQEKTCQSRTRK